MNNGLNLGRTTSRRNPKTTNMVTLCLIWMMGVILGHFHGQLILTSSSPVDVDMMLTTTAVAVAASSPPSRHDGWDSIDIFYGSKDSLERTLQSQDDTLQQLLWSSQAGQDEVIMSSLRNKTGGYFVDLAANHATHLSNTYMLETRFGWVQCTVRSIHISFRVRTCWTSAWHHWPQDPKSTLPSCSGATT